MSFYKTDNPPFILDDALEFFKEEGIRIIENDEASLFNINTIIDSHSVGKNFIATPKLDRINIPVPYEPFEHDEKYIGGNSLCEIITEYINKKFGDEKYIFSGRPDIFLAISFKEFSYRILREIFSGHLTTPIVLFDKKMDRVFIFEYDLEINSYSRTNKYIEERLGNIDDKIWIAYFNENFLKGISYNENHISLINKYYKNVFNGLRKF